MKSIFITGALSLLALSFFNGADGASCLEKLPLRTKVGEERAACIKSLNIKEADIVNVENLKEKHFNDSCLSHCIMENLHFASNGTLQKDKVLAQLKTEADAETYEKLAKVVEECAAPPKFKGSSPRPAADGEKKDKKHGHGDGKKNCRGWKCKRAAKFVYCMVEKDMNLC